MNLDIGQFLRQLLLALGLATTSVATTTAPTVAWAASDPSTSSSATTRDASRDYLVLAFARAELETALRVLDCSGIETHELAYQEYRTSLIELTSRYRGSVNLSQVGDLGQALVTAHKRLLDEVAVLDSWNALADKITNGNLPTLPARFVTERQLSEQAKAARRPRRPEELVDSRPAVDVEPGVTRPARAVRFGLG
jgi:hypothetical protein